MKITMPENLATPYAMLMKGVPETLQADKKFKNAVLVFLKMGGVSLARKFVETKIRYLDYDPLEIDTGFRFPRLQEIDTEASSEDEENETEDDEGDGEGEKEGEKDEDKPLEEKEG
jgi:hypothetical protein